jgi:hypothetical protein
MLSLHFYFYPKYKYIYIYSYVYHMISYPHVIRLKFLYA